MIHLLADDSYVMSSLCIIFGVRSLKHFMYSSCELKFDGWSSNIPYVFWGHDFQAEIQLTQFF